MLSAYISSCSHFSWMLLLSTTALISSFRFLVQGGLLLYLATGLAKQFASCYVFRLQVPCGLVGVKSVSHVVLSRTRLWLAVPQSKSSTVHCNCAVQLSFAVLSFQQEIIGAVAVASDFKRPLVQRRPSNKPSAVSWYSFKSCHLCGLSHGTK